MTEILKADPAARRKALWLVVIAALAAAGLLWYLQTAEQQLKVLTETDPALAMVRVLLALRILAVALVLSMLGFAAYLFRLGRRIQRAQRSPPPGMRVIRDTPVITGSGAQSRGRLLKLLAVVLALLGFATGVLLVLVAELVSSGGA